MRKAILAIWFLLAVQFCVRAQNWQSVGTVKFNHEIDYLFSDTATGQLFNVGLYWMMDTTPAYGMSVFDGTEWQQAFTDPVYPPKHLAKFQGQYYMCNGGHLWKWNGAGWDTAAFSFGYVGSVFNDGDSVLYALGNFTSIAGVTANKVAKFNGATWSALDNTTWQGPIYTACRYQGDIYFAGNFTNASLGIWRIARWDGISWNPVGQGVQGSIAFVNCLEEYNGELYAGGWMNISQGNPGNFIARWNGSNWSQVGGGMANGQVRSLKVFNGELWAVGAFTQAGGIPATNVAKYDGVDWCGVGVFDNWVLTMEIHNGELYIGGNFWTIDGDSVTKVVKWIGLDGPDSCGHLNTGMNEMIGRTFAVNVFPNPVTEIATFQFSDAPGKKTVLVFDQLGREIWKEETEENRIEFMAEGVERGMYFYRVEQSGQVRASGKFIVQ